jgi:hypothetical protein
VANIDGAKASGILSIQRSLLFYETVQRFPLVTLRHKSSARKNLRHRDGGEPEEKTEADINR